MNIPVESLAHVMGRGQVSGVGTALFEQGGFVVEAGVKSQGNKPRLQASVNFPPVIFRQSFPEDWFFVVAIPDVKKGLSGKEEATAFKNLQPMRREKAALISHLIIMGLLPAIKEQDIETFGKSLTEIQSLVGDYFATVQGARFSSSPAGDCIKAHAGKRSPRRGAKFLGSNRLRTCPGRSRSKKIINFN